MMIIPNNLLDTLKEARRVAVLTGAGVSAESGVPTFRQAQSGLWAQYNPEDLATPEAFQRSPRLVWQWYQWRRGLVDSAAPNPAHLALAEMQGLFPTFCLITQNVDGLHQQAGSREVIELHGNIWREKCFRDGLPVEASGEDAETPPYCPRCGGIVRPDVVWFGEALPAEALRSAWEAVKSCQVFFAIGTSALVYPAAGLPYRALEAGATLVEINPQPTPLSEAAHFILAGLAGEILPALIGAIR
jgi:NAD-dependent deacetylase